jgi:hypothetical protein
MMKERKPSKARREARRVRRSCSIGVERPGLRPRDEQDGQRHGERPRTTCQRVRMNKLQVNLEIRPSVCAIRCTLTASYQPKLIIRLKISSDTTSILGEPRSVQGRQRDDPNFILGQHDWTESSRPQRETSASSDRRTVEGVVFWAITGSVSGACKKQTSFLCSVPAASLPLFFHSSHAEDRVDTLINRSESKGEGKGDNTLDTSWSAPHAVLLFGKISQNMIMADGSSGSDVLSSRVRGSGYKHWGIID